MEQASIGDHAPLVLVVNDEEWVARTIESILKPRGYVVRMAHTGHQALDLASRIQPDLVFVDLRLPDMTGTDLCARIREVPSFHAATPLILFTSGPSTRRTRLQGFKSGAWAVMIPPFEPEELLAPLEPFLAAKQETDEALNRADLDRTTGFYNLDGLLRRAAEMSADTSRSQRAIACVALGPSKNEPESTSEEAIGEENGNGWDSTEPLAKLLLSVTRLSDAVARIGEQTFVIVAPGTGQAGAIRLAERVVDAADEGEGVRKLRVKAGLYAVPGGGPDAVVPEELLRRATDALRDAQGRDEGVRIQSSEVPAGPEP